jgi:hypothetical protein
MHSDWFNGIEILEVRWQHGEKVEYCYPSGLKKALCMCDIFCPAGHERVKWNSEHCELQRQVLQTSSHQRQKFLGESAIKAV